VIEKRFKQKMRIKEEVSSDGEDKNQKSFKESLHFALLNYVPKCEIDEGHISTSQVKKEIAFDGLPTKLQIQPLPDALIKLEVPEDKQTNKETSKPPNPGHKLLGKYCCA
jgi:hypothetical protein